MDEVFPDLFGRSVDAGNFHIVFYIPEVILSGRASDAILPIAKAPWLESTSLSKVRYCDKYAVLYIHW